MVVTSNSAEATREDPSDGIVPFNRPCLVGGEIENIRQALDRGQLSGNGTFTKQCEELVSKDLAGAPAMLTHSCTAALEMAAMLLDFQPGDEVIMPSFTFASTANAFVLRGAVPVFVDVRPDTLNIDETAIETAITSRTKAIVPVHYAGVGCEMEEIVSLAERRGIAVVEDAAQAIHATYRGRPLGTFGCLSTLSFHETKNIISGEGGALIVNRAELLERSEIIREKGTNRVQFSRGQVDKYSWVDLGSSYCPGELVAAFLLAQLQQGRQTTLRRLKLWHRYHENLASAEYDGALRRPVVPEHCLHNAHMYHILLQTAELRKEVLAVLNARGINAVFHYVPLHAAPAGLRFCRTGGPLNRTEDLAARLIRLPMFPDLTESDQDRVIDVLLDSLARF